MPERVNPPEASSPSSPGQPKPEDDRAVAVPPSVQHVGDSVTTGTMPVTDPEPVRPLTRPVKSPRWFIFLIAGWLVFGVLAGVFWQAVVSLPSYTVNAEGFAATSERGLADYIAGDAWFVMIGLVLGVAGALVAWRWFAGLGWPLVPLVIGGALVMGVICWFVGWLLGPGPLEPRLAAAAPGDVLPVELTVRGPAALLAWPFGACLTVMILAAVTRDPEDTG